MSFSFRTVRSACFTHLTGLADARFIECEISDIQVQRTSSKKPECAEEDLLATIILQ